MAGKGLPGGETVKRGLAGGNGRACRTLPAGTQGQQGRARSWKRVCVWGGSSQEWRARGQQKDKTRGWQTSDEQRNRERLRQGEVRGPEPERWHNQLGEADSHQTSLHPGWGLGCITSGEGSSSGFGESSACVTSMSPRMVRRWRAMAACCSSPQWFSRDRMTG